MCDTNSDDASEVKITCTMADGCIFLTYQALGQ